MVYFFDTSALVKRYHEEKGTEFVDELFEDVKGKEEEAFVSSLTLLEMTSAFKRKQKGNIIDEKEFDDILKTSFRELKEYFTIVPVTEETINESIFNVTEYALKSLDSIHYQTVKEVEEMVEEDIIVITSDKELFDAFVEGGYESIDPEKKSG